MAHHFICGCLKVVDLLPDPENITLAKYDWQALRFTFEFYKPKEEWIVYSFQFEDKFDDDMVEMMKLDYLSTKRRE